MQLSERMVAGRKVQSIGRAREGALTARLLQAGVRKRELLGKLIKEKEAEAHSGRGPRYALLPTPRGWRRGPRGRSSSSARRSAKRRWGRGARRGERPLPC